MLYAEIKRSSYCHKTILCKSNIEFIQLDFDHREGMCVCMCVCVSSLCLVQNMPVSQYNPWFCQGQQPQQPFATNSAVHANLAYKSAAACRHSRKDVGYAPPLQTFRYGSTNSSMMPSSSSGSTCNYNKIEKRQSNKHNSGKTRWKN